jgi:hypothetical protein
MGARRSASDRWFPRYYDIVGPCPARLYFGDGRPFEFRIVDVSRDGLGVIAPEPIAKDTVLQLDIGDRKISMRVVHCNEDLIYAGNFRVGMHRISSSENLVSLFAATGCIKV